ncbi:MAG: hypothetical protein AAGF60_02690 [Pseudomonadota bacterium]
MFSPQVLFEYYQGHKVPNPVNVTLTFKLRAEGQWLTRDAAEQNIKHFRNLLNRRLFGNACKRHGRQLRTLIVHEGTEWTRHHIHGAIELPEGWEINDFKQLVMSLWMRTRFGYREHHFEVPATAEREDCWLYYCFKKRTKLDFASSVDWANSTCFERC